MLIARQLHSCEITDENANARLYWALWTNHRHNSKHGLPNLRLTRENAFSTGILVRPRVSENITAKILFLFGKFQKDRKFLRFAQIHGATHSGKSTSLALAAIECWKKLKCIWCLLDEIPFDKLTCDESNIDLPEAPCQIIVVDSFGWCKCLRKICNKCKGRKDKFKDALVKSATNLLYAPAFENFVDKRAEKCKDEFTLCLTNIESTRLSDSTQMLLAAVQILDEYLMQDYLSKVQPPGVILSCWIEIFVFTFSLANYDFHGLCKRSQRCFVAYTFWYGHSCSSHVIWSDGLSVRSVV